MTEDQTPDWIDDFHDRWFAFLEEHPEIVEATIMAPKLSVGSAETCFGDIVVGKVSIEDIVSASINTPKLQIN